MEASTGIEPVYTDLQSTCFPSLSNRLGQKKYQDKTQTKREPDTRKKTNFMSRVIKSDHKRMARVLGYALTVGEASAWRGFSVVAMARLSVQERACLAKAALISLPEEVADLVNEPVQSGPLPAFLSLLEDAKYWASNASRNEKKAYALAAFGAMAASDQADFLRYIKRQAVSA